MNYELFKELIKEELKLSDPNQVSKLELVETALGKLALLDDDKYNKQIREYRDKKESLFKKMDEINQEITSLIDSYYKALVDGL